jgi:dTDP-4-dehydrorhamnose reductase
MTEYGRHKAEAERLLRQVDANIAIVRFAKILPPSVPLFAQWREALMLGEEITPLRDLVMAPTPIDCAVSLLHAVIERRLGGIFHMSGERDVSYAQVAFWLAEELGASKQLVQPASHVEAGLNQHIPRHTTLHSVQTCAAFGMAPLPVESSIRAAIRNSVARCTVVS